MWSFCLRQRTVREWGSRMGGLSYYIPAAAVTVAAVAAVCWIAVFIRNIIREKRGQTTCMKCKAAALKITAYPYLFLIPVLFGDVYNNAEEYLRTHMTPVLSKQQIPTGQRACMAAVFECPRCGCKQVEITDFLQVRGESYAKGHYKFAYEAFAPLLEDWERMNHQREVR